MVCEDFGNILQLRIYKVERGNLKVSDHHVAQRQALGPSVIHRVYDLAVFNCH